MVEKKAIDIIEETNLNFIDIKILAFCFNEELSVSELQEQVGIAYKNLLPHLKKLEKQNLLFIKDNGLGKKKSINTNTNTLGIHYFIFGIIALWTSEKELKKNKNLYQEIIKFLKENQKK